MSFGDGFTSTGACANGNRLYQVMAVNWFVCSLLSEAFSLLLGLESVEVSNFKTKMK